MKNTENLIRLILSDVNSDNIQKVYREEPILFPASQMQGYIPYQYQKMRKLATDYESLYMSDAEVFVRQARYMADFTDNYQKCAYADLTFPNYNELSDAQLRTYFTWRKKVREGIITSACLSFAFLYLFETINGIGIRSNQEGFDKLLRFVQSYQKIEPGLEKFASPILFDYVLYYGLDVSKCDFLPLRYDEALLLLQAPQKGEAFIKAYFLLAGIPEPESGYGNFPKDFFHTALYEVYVQLTDYFSKHRKYSLFETLFGQPKRVIYKMFSNTLFYEKSRHTDTIITINPLRKYICSNGTWLCESIFICGKNLLLCQIAEFVTCLMANEAPQKKYSFSYVIQKLIKKTVVTLQNDYWQKKQREVHLDFSLLDNIRTDARKTQQKLIVETEPEPMQSPPTTRTPVAEPNHELPFSLTQEEFDLLKAVISGTAIEPKNRFVSVLADEINQKLYESFQDTVLSTDNGQIELIEDYYEQVKGVLHL